MTASPADLLGLLASMSRVRIWASDSGGRRRSPHGCPVDVLAEVCDREALAALCAALASDVITEWACMCMGELVVELLDNERRVIAVLRFAQHGELSWEQPEASSLLPDGGTSFIAWLERWAPAAHRALPARPDFTDRFEFPESFGAARLEARPEPM